MEMHGTLSFALFAAATLPAGCATAVGGTTEAAVPDPSPRVATHVDVRVDPRVELMSIVFRLAGVSGYTMNNFRSYVSAIESHFGGHREHPAVLLVARLAREHGVAWDAPMSMAVHLTPAPALAVRMSFDDAVLDARWPRDMALLFVEQLRHFAMVSDFDSFLRSHAGLYAEIESRMRETVREQVSLDWLDGFFRQTPGAPFTVLLGLSNGGASYYTRFADGDAAEEIYSVIGAWVMDADGLPVFDETVAATVIHEMAHAYVNPLVDRHDAQLLRAGDEMYKAVEPQMEALRYPRWDLALKESLVRAVVARYQNDRQGANAAVETLASEAERGFVWIDELAALLGVYHASPQLFPSFTSLLPTLATYFADLAPRTAALAAHYDAALRPTLLSASIPAGATDVDPGTTELRFRFDRPSTFYRFYLGYPDGFGFKDRRGVGMRSGNMPLRQARREIRDQAIEGTSPSAQPFPAVSLTNLQSPARTSVDRL
jgi:hypothetical protein